MIQSYRDRETETLFLTGRSRKIGAAARSALRKLQLLDNTDRLEDLKVPNGNRLEALKGDRKGQHSIRVNDQYRLCFRWKDGDAFDVEIADYH